MNEVQAFNWKTRTRNHGHVGTIIAVFCDPDRLYCRRGRKVKEMEQSNSLFIRPLWVHLWIVLHLVRRKDTGEGQKQAITFVMESLTKCLALHCRLCVGVWRGGTSGLCSCFTESRGLGLYPTNSGSWRTGRP